MNAIIKKITMSVVIAALFSLTACGGGGSSDPVTSTNESPTLTATDQTVASASGTVNISGMAADSDGSIVSYSWVQASGPTVSLLSTTSASTSFSAPTVTVDTTLTFTLTVTDDDGATASATVLVLVTAPVIVPNATPVANAGVDQTVTSGFIGTIDLNGAGSADSDGSIASYSWAQTTGSMVTLSSASSATPTFAIPSVSATTLFTFVLTVTDDDGATATDTVVITIVNVAPTANAGADRSVESGGAGILLNGSFSTDTDGTVTGYSWSQVDGPMLSLTNANNSVASFTAPVVTANTVLTFRLVVTDNNGGATGTDDVVITVLANVAPTADAGIDQTKVSGSGDTVTLSGSGSADSDGTISYSWVQTGGAAVSLASSNTVSPSFTTPSVSANTSYTFTLTVTDNAGVTAADSVVVNVTNAVPTASAGTDQTVASGTTSVSLDASASVDSDGSIASYSWTQVSGPSVSLTNSATSVATFTAPSVTVETSLTFSVTVTDDNGGAIATDQIIVTVSVPTLDVVVSASDVKTVQLSWSAFSGATFYRLLVNADGASGFTLQTDNISTTSTSFTLPVHFTDWANGKYILEAHDGSGLLKSSTEFGITSEMLNTIGYFKASNPTTNDRFGGALSISADGSTLAIGASNESGSSAGVDGADNDLLSASGAVYVYTLSGTTWTQQAYIKASNPGAIDRFGAAISLSSDGSILAVGAPTEDSSATGIDGTVDELVKDSGAVYVFTRNAATWTEQAYIKASNTGVEDSFGASLSLSADGTTLAVSGKSEGGSSAGINGADNDLLFSSGAVYVFVYGGSPTPAWSQQAYIKSDNPSKADVFGASISLSADGDTLAVGAYFEDGSTTGVNGADDDGLYNSGAAYVFTRTTTTWSQQAYIKASNPSISDMFGIILNLSADGNTLAINAYSEDGSSSGINGADDDLLSGSGAVYVFSRSASTWSQQAYVKASNPGQDDIFGLSISLSADGNTMAVGAVFEDGSTTGINGADDDLSVNAGAVYLYSRSASTWSQQVYIKAKNTETSDHFGAAVGLSSDGQIMAIGAHGEAGSGTGVNGTNDNTLPAAGAVYLY